MKMNRTFINSFNFSFAEGTNQFIYFLKRIPVIGRRIPEKLYRQTDVKIFLGILSTILGILSAMVRKALYIGIVIVVPMLLIKDFVNAKPINIFLNILFFLNFILGPIIKSKIMNKYDKKAFNMIVLMRAEAKEYYIGQLLYNNLCDFVYFLPAMIITGLFIGCNPLMSIILIVEIITLRFSGEFVQLYLYCKRKIILSDKNAFMIIFASSGLFLAYGLPALKIFIDFKAFLFNPIVVILLISAGIAGFMYLLKYDDYVLLSKVLLTRDNIFKLGKVATDMEFGAVKLNEKRMSKEEMDSKAYNNKKGYEYLNSIFFLRHRSIMVTPLKQLTAVIGIVCLILSMAVIFVPQSRTPILKSIPDRTPAFVFLMYAISTGERICKAMFYNCDVSLLRYSYYREGKVILNNFTSRLKRVVLINLIPAAAICLAMSIIMIAGGSVERIISLVPLYICIICLACFFSIHNLFMYYVLQPYTAELTVKSPLYKLVRIVMYMICYGCIQIKTSSSIFTLGVIAVTVVYMMAALSITYRVAPKTFRLK